MAGLLYQNFVLHKTNFLFSWIGIVFMSAFLLIPTSNELDDSAVYACIASTILVVIFMLTGIEQQGIFAADERKKWADFIGASPLTGKGQVRAKYFFSLLLSLVTLIYCNLLLSVNAVIQGADSGVSGIVIALFLFQLWLRSVEFPFLIRFGSKFGNNFRMVGGFALVLLLLVYLLFGDLSVFGTMDDFLAWFETLINGTVFTTTMKLLLSLAPALIALLYYGSYKLSCRWYLKGVETYEK